MLRNQRGFLKIFSSGANVTAYWRYKTDFRISQSKMETKKNGS